MLSKTIRYASHWDAYIYLNSYYCRATSTSTTSCLAESTCTVEVLLVLPRLSFKVCWYHCIRHTLIPLRYWWSSFLHSLRRSCYSPRLLWKQSWREPVRWIQRLLHPFSKSGTIQEVGYRIRNSGHWDIPRAWTVSSYLTKFTMLTPETLQRYMRICKTRSVQRLWWNPIEATTSRDFWVSQLLIDCHQ